MRWLAAVTAAISRQFSADSRPRVRVSDELAAGRVGLDFTPQVADVYVQHCGAHRRIRRPDFAQQLPVGQHLAGTGSQRLEQLVLMGVRDTSRPSEVTSLLDMSSTRPPEVKTGPPVSLQQRRIAARSLASSSPVPKGLVRIVVRPGIERAATLSFSAPRTDRIIMGICVHSRTRRVTSTPSDIG